MSTRVSSRYSGQFPPRFSRLHEDTDLLWVVPFPVRYIIGVTGFRFAGKTSALGYLTEKHGVRMYTLSSVLREIAADRGIPLRPRARLQDLGDELRAETGDGGYLARRVLRQIRHDLLSQNPGEPPQRIVVGGFKHPDEVRVFQRVGRFHMLVLEAHPKVRWSRGRRDGLVQEELSAVTTSGSATGSGAATFESFETYLDRRDRVGWNQLEHEASRGARDRKPWVKGFDQAVDGVVAASRRAEDVLIDNGIAEHSRRRLTALYHELDTAIAGLDDRYHATS